MYVCVSPGAGTEVTHRVQSSPSAAACPMASACSRVGCSRRTPCFSSVTGLGSFMPRSLIGFEVHQALWRWQAHPDGLRRHAMKHTRIVVSRYGGPDELHAVVENCPEPKAGEARVKVLAAGVSLPDVMMREGIHPEAPLLPFTPGWDFVGVVDRTGIGASAVQAGEWVAALPISGAYAEFIFLPQEELVPVPAGLDPADAVCLILNYITAYQMLHRAAHV